MLQDTHQTATKERHGQGAIVLVHGSGTGARFWQPVLELLAANGHRPAAVDRIGYGAAPHAANQYGITAEVEWLATAVKEAQARGPIHLVAHSLGALFALHFVRKYPDSVARLTLVEPVVVALLRDAHECEAYAEIGRMYDTFMEYYRNPSDAVRYFVEYWAGGASAWNALGDHGRAAMVKMAPRLKQELEVSRGDTTSLGEYAEVRRPITIVTGERTLSVPLAVSRVLVARLNASAFSLPGAGHMAPVTHAADVARAIISVHGLPDPEPGFKPLMGTGTHTGMPERARTSTGQPRNTHRSP